MPNEVDHGADGGHDFLGRLGLWTVVCSVSALPSFIVAANNGRSVPAMVCGVLVFIVAYTMVTGTDFVRRVRRQPLVKRTLGIGYGTRLTVSIIYPIGFALDVLPGALSSALVSAFAGNCVMDTFLSSFPATLATTVLTGGFLNVILLVYMGIIYGIQRRFCSPAVLEGCLGCGYNLTGNVSGRCPECGKEVPPTEKERRRCQDASNSPQSFRPPDPSRSGSKSSSGE